MPAFEAPQRTAYHVGNLAEQLLAAARQMLAEVGPAKLSLRAISERVGVSPTAAYHHFANRGELVAHLAAEGFRELRKVLAQPTADADLLRQACLAYFRFARQNPTLYQLMFGADVVSADSLPELLAARDEAFGEVERVIAALLGVDPGSATARGAALASWSYIHGLASLVLHGVMQIPSDVSDERLVELTLQGLRNIYQARTAG